MTDQLSTPLHATLHTNRGDIRLELLPDHAPKTVRNFVELAEGLEGLCHVSELSEDRVERPEDAAQVGQEIDFRILRIEPESKKIGLSARAARHDEPIMDTKSYTSDAGGGMASLGELADFFNKRGGGSEGEGGR